MPVEAGEKILKRGEPIIEERSLEYRAFLCFRKSHNCSGTLLVQQRIHVFPFVSVCTAMYLAPVGGRSCHTASEGGHVTYSWYKYQFIPRESRGDQGEIL